jgi:hypothetical protein
MLDLDNMPIHTSAILLRVSTDICLKVHQMGKKKELEIHTVIVDGKAKSFRAALSRSLMGVTWVKFKRRKQAFYRHRAHNLSVTQSLFNWLYESLLTDLRNLSVFKLKTDLKPQWNDNGRIEAISNLTVSVYMKVGELKVKKLQIHEKFKSVKIDLFYSKVDLASQKLRSELPEIIESMGKEDFDYNEYDILTKEGREMAEAYDVKGTPTVVVNAENKLPNPDETKLRQEIEKAFAPVVKPVGESQFNFDPQAEPTVKSLTNILEVNA